MPKLRDVANILTTKLFPDGTLPWRKTRKPTRSFSEFFHWLTSDMNYSPEICIDVGAAMGTPELYGAFKNAKHYAFEPIETFAPMLKKRLANYDHELFMMAVMDKPGNRIIALTENECGSTLMARKKDRRKAKEIAVSTLDIEIGDRVKGKQTLLKTDCQGGDLAAIKGGENVIQHCDVIIMETSFYRYWGNHHPDFYDIVHYMKTKGFVVIDMLDGIFKPSNSALGQIDLVFAKENGVLRPHHRW